MSENVSELEQQEYYAQLAKKTSESLAYFYCCVKYDVPLRATACRAMKGATSGFRTSITSISRNWMPARAASVTASSMA